MHETRELARVAPEDLRAGMALLAGAVNIVTTDGPAGRAGFTASAVCSVTDSPPTLLVCVKRDSSVGDAFLTNVAICVNTVSSRHRELAHLFGGKTPAEQRFAAARWYTLSTGAPVLEGALASFDCSVESWQDVGSHRVLFCAVHAVQTREEEAACVYFNRAYHEVAAA